MPRTQTVSARVDPVSRGIPFSVTIPNKTTLKAMKDADARRNSKSFKTTKALIKDLGI